MPSPFDSQALAHQPDNRIYQRFSDHAEDIRAVNKFRSAYRQATFGVEIGAPQPKLELNVPTSWFVIPFDFVLGNARVQQAINRLKVPFNGAFSRVRVSWSLGNQHLMHLLRK